MSGFKELRKASSTLPPTLNADSDATVDSGMVKISRAILRVKDIDLHLFSSTQERQKPQRGSLLSSKYISNSDLETDSNS